MFDIFSSRNRAPGLEEQAYRRLFDKGYRPTSIIDVGAYEGNWTRLARNVFPNATSLMVEPQVGKASLLERLAEELPRTKFESEVLASEAGAEIIFYEMETGSSFLPESSNVTRDIKKLIAKTLDQLAANLVGPIFLKIDAQGAELEILKGSRQTIKRCDLIQLEVALLPYNEGAPEIFEVLDYMNDMDFVPYDIAGMIRPGGVDLVQIDFLFVPKSSPLRPNFFTF